MEELARKAHSVRMSADLFDLYKVSSRVEFKEAPSGT